MGVQKIEALAQNWIQAWNQRDLEAVLSHYTEDVEFQSPPCGQTSRRDFRDRPGKTRPAEVFPKGSFGLSGRHRARTARRLPGSEQRAGSFPGERKKSRRGHGTEPRG